MSTSGITTRTAISADLEAVTDLCLAAFADEAVTVLLTPEPDERQRYVHQMFSNSLETVINTGALILATDPRGDPVA